MLREIINSIKLFNILRKLDNKGRTSVYRMIYWCTHYNGIPRSENKLLVDDGWLIGYYDFDGVLSYKWTEKAYKITKLVKFEKYGYTYV